MNKKTIHVMLIDDDEDEDFFFRLSLNELGGTYNYNYVTNLDSAFKILAHNHHHYIFIDLNMPKQNGLYCIQQIRLEEKFQESIIVLYSTAIDPQVCQRALELGANKCIRKTSFSLFTEILNEILLVNNQD